MERNEMFVTSVQTCPPLNVPLLVSKKFMHFTVLLIKNIQAVGYLSFIKFYNKLSVHTNLTYAELGK